MFKYLQRNIRLFRIGLIAILILAAYFASLIRIKPIEIASLKTGDLISYISHRLSRPPASLKDITVIAIDDVSLKRVGKRWPWPRDVLIEALEKIEGFSPRVIGIDLLLIGEGENPAEDLELADVFKSYNNIILASHFAETGEYIKPRSIFVESALAYGHINKPRDTDLVVRRSRPLVFSRKGRPIDFSFELKMAAAYFRIPFENIIYCDGHVILKSALGKDKDIIFPVDKTGSAYINFSTTGKTIRMVPVWKVLKGEVPMDMIEGKTVLIGVTSEIFHDVYPTYLGIMPGILLNVNDILTIINGDFLHRLSRWGDFSIMLILCMLTIWLTHNQPVRIGIFISFFGIVVTTLLSIFLRLQDIAFDLFGAVFMIAATYTTIYSYKYISLMIENAILKKEAITDGLTGLFVYRYFELRLQSEFNKSSIERSNLSLVILDLDRFKNLNDTYGHEEGNFILKELSALLTKSSRKTDVIARYGGEEFCIILPDTSLDNAVKHAENLRKQIKEKEFVSPSGNTHKITVSFGVAGNKSEGVSDASSLIKTADAALYETKRTGRDKVCKL